MNYEDIQKLKKEYDYCEFNYIRPMSIRLYSKSIKLVIKCFLQAILFEPNIDYKNNDSNILVSYAFEKDRRKDYDEIIENLKFMLNNYNEIFLLYKLNILKIPIEILIFIWNLIFFKLNHKVKFFDRIKINSLYMTAKKLEKKLKNLNLKEDLLISFCDAHFEENILTQIFKLKSGKTITLQHGQYRFMEKGHEDENAEAYMNFISDYMFVWGNKTKNEIKKGNIDVKRLYIVGALKNFSQKEKKKIKNGVFGLILDGEIYKESNLSMVSLANIISKEFGKKFFIRFHPMNNRGYYEEYVLKENYIDFDTAKEGEFFILHKTSVLIEMLGNSQKIFIYNDKYQEEIFRIDDILFSDYESFINCFNKELDFNYIELYKEFNIDDTFEILKNNYLNSINEIMSK